MFLKNKNKDFFFDKLHKGFVNVCLAVTLATGTMIVFKAIEYFTYVRPAQNLVAEKTKEELLAEGRPLEDTAKEMN